MENISFRNGINRTSLSESTTYPRESDHVKCDRFVTTTLKNIVYENNMV